jgi:hypothetical protein
MIRNNNKLPVATNRFQIDSDDSCGEKLMLIQVTEAILPHIQELQTDEKNSMNIQSLSSLNSTHMLHECSDKFARLDSDRTL